MASKSYFLFKPHLQYVPPPLSLLFSGSACAACCATCAFPSCTCACVSCMLNVHLPELFVPVCQYLCLQLCAKCASASASCARASQCFLLNPQNQGASARHTLAPTPCPPFIPDFLLFPEFLPDNFCQSLWQNEDSRNRPLTASFPLKKTQRSGSIKPDGPGGGAFGVIGPGGELPCTCNYIITQLIHTCRYYACYV